MNYQTHHNRIIERAQNRVLEGYCERHHIIPRCMGGDDSADNIVYLTAGEHYVIHQLLVKLYPKNTKIVWAALMMTVDRNGQRINNRRYAWLKKKASIIQSNKMKGNVLSEEHKRKISEANRGKSLSKKHKQIISKTHKGKIPWNKGIPRTEEVKAKLRKPKINGTNSLKGKTYEEIHGPKKAAELRARRVITTKRQRRKQKIA